MAARINSSGDTISMVSPLLPFPHTVCFWVYMLTDQGRRTSFLVYNTGSVYLFGTDLSGTRLNFYNGADNTGTDLSLNTWYHLAIVAAAGSGAARTVYLNGVLDISTTGNEVASGTAYFGNNSTTSQWNDARFAAIKAWNAELTQAEILQEMWTYQPRRFADIHGWFPLLGPTSIGQNFAGNANVLGTSGVVVEDGPPVGWGFEETPILSVTAAAAATARSQIIVCG